jgi:DNA-binding response OmpR family regulator
MTSVDLARQQAVHTIFVADDDSDDRLILGQALKEIDPAFKIESTENGNELMSLLSNLKPDFLFLDLEMPYKNGLECLKEIRANPALADLPVVVFSSTSRPVNIDVAYEMGADLFFIKPSIFKTLVASVKAILALDWNNRTTIKEAYLQNGKYTAFT